MTQNLLQKIGKTIVSMVLVASPYLDFIHSEEPTQSANPPEASNTDASYAGITKRLERIIQLVKKRPDYNLPLIDRPILNHCYLITKKDKDGKETYHFSIWTDAFRGKIEQFSYRGSIGDTTELEDNEGARRCFSDNITAKDGHIHLDFRDDTQNLSRYHALLDAIETDLKRDSTKEKKEK